MPYAVQKTPAAYSTGTWAPTFAGFSADPTVTARYILVGKMCFWWITTSAHGTGSGTSASGTTFTLPFTSYNGISQRGWIGTLNNATPADGVWIVGSNSNVATVYINSSLTGTWTNAVNRSFNGFGVYEIA